LAWRLVIGLFRALVIVYIFESVVGKASVQKMDLKTIVATRSSCLTVPGCWDGLSARLIEQAGFELAFLSGGAHAMGRFGLPDMGFVSLDQLADTVRNIADCADLALIVDADTGFGNALNTAQTVRVLERAGANAIQLEDQNFPKRCGHMAGKTVISAIDAAGKIKAATDARASSSTLIIARTDAASIDGIKAAMDRADLYLQAGADLIFIEGPESLADMARVHGHFYGRVPLVHNMVGGGTNPITQPTQLDEVGIAIALHPLMLMSAFVQSAASVLADLAASQMPMSNPIDSSELALLNAKVGTTDFLARASEYG
jgi:2-methylisocitrate lyase-like PEP mutase family enzyme